MITDRMQRRFWRGVADGRRGITRSGSARPALETLGDPTRNDLDEWMRRTSDAHDEYRRTIEPAEGRIAVVCVSHRPHLVGDVAANIERQTGLDQERLDVVYIATHDGDLGPAARALESSNAVVERIGAEATLGAGLNLAMSRTDARFIAKFDDDDLYGPHHVADSLRAHSYAGAGVVGKHCYYAHLARTDDTVLRFPGHEYTYTSTLAGGTLVIDRDRVGDQQFDDISIGEDRAFIAACHRRGISTFSADRFNFTQVRSGDNTWTIADDDFRRGTLDVDPSSAVHRIDR